MWLVPPSLASVLDSGDSSEQSATAIQSHVWLVTLSGKATQQRYSWRGWKTRPWSRLLFGAATSPSFRVSHFSEWTSSLPAFRVNPGAALVGDEVPTTSDGYGPTSLDLLAEWDAELSSLRTSRLSLFEVDSSSSSLTLPRSGSMRNGQCFERPMLELRTAETDSSSWPTAAAADGERTSETMMRGNPTLLGAARGAQWPTPAAQEDQRSPEAHMKMRSELPGGPRSTVSSLTVAAKMWPTATAMDARGSGSSEYSDGVSVTLTDAAARNWPTPRASANENRTGTVGPTHGESHGRLLAGEAAAHEWPTPKASTGGPDYAKEGRSSTGLALPAVATNWATPTATDGKGAIVDPGGDQALMRQSRGEGGASKLPDHAVLFLRDPTTEQPGKERRPVLNPRFVERLMGLPIGWVLPMPLSTINLEHSGTGSSGNKRRRRSESSPPE